MVWVLIHFLPCIGAIVHFVLLNFACNDHFPTKRLLSLLDKLCQLVTYPIHLVLRFFIAVIDPAEVEFGLHRRHRVGLSACPPMPCCSAFPGGCIADLAWSWGGRCCNSLSLLMWWYPFTLLVSGWWRERLGFLAPISP